MLVVRLSKIHVTCNTDDKTRKRKNLGTPDIQHQPVIR